MDTGNAGWSAWTWGERVGALVGFAAVVMINHVSCLLGMDVDDAVPVVVPLCVVRLGRHRRTLPRAGLMRVEARHGGAMQHERRHCGEHYARHKVT